MSAERQHVMKLHAGLACGLFFGVSAVALMASVAVTVVWCESMSAMKGMVMPGGWTMSMAWMRMPDQTWLDAAASFIGMWIVMMIAMMLPSLMPMLLRYRRQIGIDHASRLGSLTAIVAAGYFAVWAAIGIAAYPAGVAVSALTMRSTALSQAVPLLTAVVALVVGALQFTGWKLRQLACCRRACRIPCRGQSAVGAAWLHGVQLGFRCSRCCGGLMLLLLVIGVMDLRAMALLTAAITAERLLPDGRYIAPVIGMVIIILALWLVTQARPPL